MKDLIKLGENTYVLKSKSNIGIYKIDNNNVCLIDTGLKEEYSKIIDILNNNNWKLQYIINTHTHSDHTANNKSLIDLYNVDVYANNLELIYLSNPELMPTILYGGKYIKELDNKILMGDSISNIKDINNLNIPGIKYINLPGHTLGSIGIITSDNVLFTGDSYTSTNILKKQSIQFTTDIYLALDTLKKLKKYKFSYYVPSHGEIEDNIEDTINTNIEYISINIKIILNFIDNTSYEELLKNIFDYYHIKMDTLKYYLIGFTIKSYLTFLYNNKLIKFDYSNNLFKIIKIS